MNNLNEKVRDYFLYKQYIRMRDYMSDCHEIHENWLKRDEFSLSVCWKVEKRTFRQTNLTIKLISNIIATSLTSRI